MKKLLFGALGALLATIINGTSAQALNDRSWVASNGTGTVCTRVTPCLTFSAAQDATADGGTILCVDNGDFSNLPGTFTITKSLTIDCGGSLGVHGRVNIHIAGTGIVVHLRNLLIDGGVTNPGGISTSSVGVNFISGSALYIENCTISGWNKGAGQGIRFTPPDGVTAKLVVLDSTIVDNGITGTAGTGGIFIQPAGSGIARVSIDRTKIVGNSYGIYADGTSGTGLISVLIKDSFIANSSAIGVSLLTTASSAQVSITMDHSSSVGNGADGVLSSGPKSFALLTESTVIGNFGTGVQPVNGGRSFSFKNNALIGNVTDVSPTNFFDLQ